MKLIKFNQNGRSMVEMLGVLAIIGVLSVGAIAGYSKAMMKYKLNKHAEQLNTILNAAYRYKAIFGTSNVLPQTLVPYLIKLKEIPEDMIKSGDENYVYDVFGSKIAINTNGCPDGLNCTGMLIVFQPPLNNFDVCLNIFNTAKAFHEQLWYFGAYRYIGEPKPEYDNHFWGDKYCSNKKCIRDITMDDIYDKCQFIAQQDRSYFTIEFEIDD